MATAKSAVQVRGVTANKFSPPRPASILVERPRLTEALDAGLSLRDATLMVVSAPAGYGKTSLLTQWARTSSRDGATVAWCDLDSDDRDPLVFWNSVLGALRFAADGNDAADFAVRALEPSVEPRGHSDFVTRLAHAFELFGPRVILIFDDTHLLESSDSEAEFLRLLRIVPPSVYIVFATRSSLLEQRTRLTNRLHELTADSLSFTRAETDALFGDQLDKDSLESLYAAAEGWPAALCLARLGVERSEPSLDARLALLDSDVLHQYLQREVYRDLDSSDRAVMHTLAVCPLITADLANAMCDGLDSANALRRLARANPMLRRVSTDRHGRTWYRVQPLFGAFLREMVTELSPRALPRMTDRAARWHVEHADALVALELALQSGDCDLVDSVLRRSGTELIAAGHASAVLALAASSSGRALGGPFASLILAWAAVAVGEVERAEDMVSRVRPTGLGVDDLFEWDWLLYLVQVRIACARGERIDGLASGWADSTMLSLPDSLRASVHLARGLAETRIGVSARATEELEASRAIAENLGDLSNQIMSAVGLAATALGRTDLRATRQHAETAIDIASRSTTQDRSEAMAYAHLLAGWSSHELLDDCAASAHASSALVFAAQQPLEDIVTESKHAFQAINFDSLPDKRRAAQDFTTAWPPPYLRGAPATAVVSSLHFGIRMSLTLGEHRWSERLLDRARHLIGEGHDWHVAYALFLHATGRQAAARGILTPLLHESRRPRAALSEIVEWSLEAVLEHESGNAFRSHAAMNRSLECADETGALAEVVGPGADAVRAILVRGLHRFGAHDEIAMQLVAHGRGNESPAQASSSLTPKERELLAELKSLRTVGEISDDMLLSINTVKTHMRGIYRKLGVTSRRSAIAEAERLGLI